MDPNLDSLLTAARERTLTTGQVKSAFVGGVLYRDSKFLENGGVRVLAVPGCKRMTVVRLSNHNPVIETDNEGVLYRYHGEFRHVRDDLEVLAGVAPRT